MPYSPLATAPDFNLARLPFELVKMILDEIAREVIFGPYQTYPAWHRTRQSLLCMKRDWDGLLAVELAKSLDRIFDLPARPAKARRSREGPPGGLPSGGAAANINSNDNDNGEDNGAQPESDINAIARFGASENFGREDEVTARGFACEMSSRDYYERFVHEQPAPSPWPAASSPLPPAASAAAAAPLRETNRDGDKDKDKALINNDNNNNNNKKESRRYSISDLAEKFLLPA